jgi:hypothetical protein
MGIALMGIALTLYDWLLSAVVVDQMSGLFMVMA